MADDYLPIPPVPDVGWEPYAGGGAYDPTVAAPAGWGQVPPMGFGQSLSQVGGALKNLTSGVGQGAGAAGAQDQWKPMSLQMAQAQAGRGGGGAQYLANLVQMLNARRDQYLNAATGGTQQPVATARGLLGI